jgi:hypothetical protein
MKKSLNKKR